MIALTHFETDAPDFESRAGTALAALAARPGYRRGSLGRSTDDTRAWVLLTEWEDVGSYRRALGNYEVKLHATPLLAEARDLPGGFEALLDAAPGGVVVARASDREPGW
ncbi:Antibiotic biosynthesis monooxygenase [Jatrophihabitans endophyticus]|uniref:Antibiotic biosynthesis monooxygenase n=1 Tax=Jatrophihabitans endophyticus TaxID=1206085 RepID=A0A1M5KG14_9ACTN|nr:antibiotic biosynthesis monooxygenase [Jatrophihabitans endophyticus]SHG51645.1 Antibiotic biosynthesis monooxygenase [Jatrophihabitans endophyticus]